MTSTAAGKPEQRSDDLNDSWVELHYQASPMKPEATSSSTDRPDLPISSSTGSMERLLIDAQRESRTPSRPNSNQSSQGGSPKSPASPTTEWSNEWRSKQDPGTEWMWDWSSRPEVHMSLDSMCEKYRHPGGVSGGKRRTPLSVRNTSVMGKTRIFSLANLPTLLLTHACTFFLGAAAVIIYFKKYCNISTIARATMD